MKYLILLAFSQAADVGSTAFSIAHGAQELNPVLGFLMTGGWEAVLLAKAALVILAAICIVHATRFGLRYIRLTNRVILVLAIIALAVAAFNMVSWI